MEHGETFYGMSSMNEYWNSSSETYSDDSSIESLSSNKEYRDASCNVDFDDELDEIVDEGESGIEESSRKSVNFTSTIENYVGSKSSRYVRWDVLMSLGIGLWAVLCIVDVLHSEESVARDWLYESVRGKTNVSKTVSFKKPAPYVWWFFDLWPYLWKIISISSAGCAYVLLFLLLIVFCADPRLRTSGGDTLVKSNVNSKIPPAKVVQDPIVENKSISLCKKSSLVVEPAVRRAGPVRLELRPAIYLHARILSSIEEQFVYEFTELKPKGPCDFGAREELPSTQKILHASSQTEYRKPFGIKKGLLAQLDIASYGTCKFTNIGRADRHSIAEDPSVTPMNLMDSSNGTYAVRTFHLKIEEYMRKRKRYSTEVFGDWFANVRGIETTGESTESSNIEETKTRIITSSPAFKKFLLRLKCNEAASFEIATRRHVFRDNLQDM